MNSRSIDGAHPRKQSGLKLILIAMITLLVVAQISMGGEAYASGASSNTSVPFQKCATGSRKACVVDGDTLWLEGQKIRIANIETPEVSEPKCSSELALGNRATDRMIELINEGPFELKAWPGRDADRYGRKLRVLIRDGRSLGDILVSEGLARAWSGRREPWC